MNKTRLVGGQVRYEFPELQEPFIKILETVSLVKLVRGDETSFFVDLVLNDPCRLMIYRHFPDDGVEKLLSGVVVNPDTLYVIDRRLPPIRIVERPFGCTRKVTLQIWLQVILPLNERHHVGRGYYLPNMKEFAIGLTHGVYYAWWSNQ